MASGGERAESLLGKVAVASAKMAYVAYKEIFGGDDFAQTLRGGRKTAASLVGEHQHQNPSYSEDKYVEPLIGDPTVNTMAQKTLDYYRESGEPAATLEQGADEADKTLTTLESLGISIDEATQQLEDEGVEKFVTPFGSLMDTLAKARDEALEKPTA